MDLSQKRLKELLHYEPETGVFTWRITRNSNAKAGFVAGNLDGRKCSGYVKISINYKLYAAHRLAWLYVHGDWPPEQIDHINRVRHDNRIENLRLANNQQNCQNRSIRQDNKTGCPGITWRDDLCKWRVRIGVNGQRVNLGYFSDLNCAVAKYQEAKAQLHQCGEVLAYRGGK